MRPEIKLDNLADYPNMFFGVEYPLNFLFFSWARDLDPSVFEDGDVLGEANTVGPHQELVWMEGSIVARAKR